MGKVYDMLLRIVGVGFVLIVTLYLFGYLPPDYWRFESMTLVCLFLLFYGGSIQKAVVEKRRISVLWNVAMLIMGVSSSIYAILEISRLEMFFGTVWVPMDIVFGLFLMISLLEVTRQSFGWALPVIALIFLAYTLLGDLLPRNFFQHTGFSFAKTISFMYSPEGIFGIVYSTFVSIIFVYLLFGTFLNNTGVGKFLVDLSFAAAGRWRGGPAKVAVVASAIMGTINGNSVANVATTGAITIPLMKKTGYKPAFAGAVEAAASTGGQILPPVMGAGAFIMAEFLQIGYHVVILAALLPAILYFIGVFLMVDLEAVKTNLKGIPDSPKIGKVLKEGFYLMIPVVVLIYLLMFEKMSIDRSGFIAIAVSIAVSWLTKEHKMGLKKIAVTMAEGARSACGIGGMCAAAGIVIGTVSMTGLGNQFSSVVIHLAGNNYFLVAVLTALITIVLGMGLPTTAAYIISMAVAVPALAGIGVEPLAAHLFVFYFAVVSAITPPVGAAFYTGAAIAEAPIMSTGINSVRIGIGAYTVPFFFVFSPVLLLNGNFFEISQAFLTAILGISAITMAMQRITFRGNKLNLIQQAAFLIAFFLLVDPEPVSDLYGILVYVLALFLRPWKRGEKS